MESLHTLATDLGLDPEVYHNPARFIATVRVGISGFTLKRALEHLGAEELFAQALGTDAAGLEGYCRATRLDRRTSEIVLDTIRVWYRVCRIWEVDQLAQDWLRSSVPALGSARPLELLDTFEGRRWVMDIAEKIEQGDFS